ncbi:MAG: glycerol-3-phosphate 1-O-acyltransferase PlsY [Myxococcota bacterium]
MILATFYLLLTYLLASIPFGLLLSVIVADIDPRTAGSRNIGATNVYRLAGARLGALTLVADMLKGFLPALLAPLVHPGPYFVGLVAFTAFAGHCYSAYLNFKGGKGVATATGVFLAISPIATIISFVTWLVIVRLTRRSSLGALTATVLLLPLMYGLTPDSLWIGVIIAVGIVIRHIDNIRRLLGGTELST